MSSQPTHQPAFPLDYLPRGGSENIYDYVDTSLGDAQFFQALSGLCATTFYVSPSEVIASAFCATSYRVSGRNDGVIDFLAGSGADIVGISYDVDPRVSFANFAVTVSSTIVRGRTSAPEVSGASTLLVFTSPTEGSTYLTRVNGHSEWQISFVEGVLQARIHFSRQLFHDTSISLFADCFSRVLQASIMHPTTPISSLILTASADIDELRRWNRTDKKDLDFASIGDMFRAWALKIPDAVAVQNGDHSVSLTYRELDRLSDSLARWLRLQLQNDNGEVVIGMYQTRTAILVLSYLACLKAGYAYMPIDTSLPAERIRRMLVDSKSPLVLGYGADADSFPYVEAVNYFDLSTLDMHRLFDVTSSPTTPLPSVTRDRLSSVMFTSGSTGTPKAIMIQHSCLLNYILSDYTPIQQGDRTAMIINIAFDVSGGEIWYPLSRGATLVCHMQNPRAPFNVDALSEFLEREDINSFHAPTAVLKSLVETNFFEKPLPSLRAVAMGGEAAFLHFVRPILAAKPHLIISNDYGPSESTVFATGFVIPPTYNRATISIGKPLSNIGALVVDVDLNPVPRGVCGELLLTGKSLARGYFGRDDLTSEAFIHLNAAHILGPLRAYRTGDLVRRTASGDLDFVRRVKLGQVKVRGYRVELGEIERTAERHIAVRSAVAVVCNFGEGDDRIVVYLTSNSDACIHDLPGDVKTHLSALLPHYMVPSIILPVQSLPLSTTGKVDRRVMASRSFVEQKMAAIRTIGQERESLVDHAKISPEEAIVLDIFARALGVPSNTISLDSNLFDIGGHSLIATRIVAAIRRSFGVAFSIAAFYDDATVSGIIANLRSCALEEEASLTRISELDSVEVCPASDVQTRLWVEEQMNPGLSRYHEGFQRRLTGTLNIDALRLSFEHLVEQHEALRTVFEMQGSSLAQRVKALDECPPVRIVDLQREYSSAKDIEALARKILAEEHTRPFDLAVDGPARFTIIKITSDLHFISAVIHHIATDGWSTGIIDKDITTLYNAFSSGTQPVLDPIPLRYRDYSVWRHRRLQDDALKTQLAYWKEHLQGVKPLELRADYLRPHKLSGNASEVSIRFGEGDVTALRQLAAAQRTSLYVVLLAAFRSAIFRVTGEDDGSIGMTNANRPRAELDNIVGFFVNTHAVRLPISSETNFLDLVIETRKVTTAALENAEVPFDKVVAHLSPKRDPSRNPLAQIMFVLQDFSGVSSSMQGRGLRGLSVEQIRNASTRLDLSLHLFVDGAELHGYLMYQTDLFSSDTISTFSDVFQRTVQAAIENPTTPISKLPLANTDDIRKLTAWNDTKVEGHDLDSSIGDRFRGVVGDRASSTAVVDSSTSLTFAQLDEQSDRLALWIVRRGLLHEAAVAVSLPRSALLVVAYLACLKAGKPYMPLDVSLPADRMRLMLSEARCQLLLATGEHPLLGELPTVDLTRDADIIVSTPAASLPAISPDTLSNIIFTSGSTGVPKGVMVEHRGMLNLCAPETTNWSAPMKNGLTSSIGFDPSGFQILTSLLSGLELHVLPDSGVFDVEEFQRFIVDSGVERIYITPSVLGALLDLQSDWLERSSLRHITLGGEKLVPAQVAEALRRRSSLEFSSSYGPAEASVRSAYFAIDTSIVDDRLSRIPIGRALPNTQIHIVDECIMPVPAGVVGEIIVSGINLARGYLNRPDLTSERFVHAPADSPLRGRRYYRTGDLGYWTSDGQVQYVGRMDTQLKIRGQRLEAGEVEAVLNRHPAVESSAVVVVPSPHLGDQLVAYIQLSSKAIDVTNDEGVVALWEDRYDEEDTYGKLDDNVAGHDFTRWVSMFNGEQIPVTEMQEWLDDTIQQIRPTSTDRVLELGVGTGKIALNVVEKVASFVGTDISSVCVRFMETQIERRALASKLAVYHGAAHEFDVLPQGQHYSLAVINSVAQYFPSPEYLVQVISKLLDVIPRGRIFIGDVRSFALIQFHDLERALATLEDDASIDDLRDMLRSYADAQAELLLSPSFFLSLKAKHPRITHVEIMPKYMTARNELSRYRYSVTLHVGEDAPVLVTPSSWVDCANMASLVPGLRKQLQQTSHSSLGAYNIQIEDIEIVHEFLQTIHDRTLAAKVFSNVSNVREQLYDRLAHTSSTPASLIQMAKEEGWRVTLDSSIQGDAQTCLRAIFVRGDDENDHKAPVIGNFPPPPTSSLSSHNTLAVAHVDNTSLVSSIDKYLRKLLPSFMVPSSIIPVEDLPLNRSGKLDRKLLSSPEYLKEFDTIALTEEIGNLTDTERRVLAIFAHALGRQPDTINVRESLFNLGGHSLMATLVVSAVRREFGSSLSIVNFFRHPTVKDIAALLDIELNAPSPTVASSHPETKAESTGASSTIVVNQNAPGPALFLFPEATGFASVYSSAFASISHKVVAFGDARWGEALDTNPTESIRSVVASFLPRIREQQPRGPYFLAGWSLGGYMAIEAADQLRAAGDDVRLVVMFDTSVYDRPLGDEPWRAELDPLLSIVDDKESWLAQFSRANRMVTRYGDRLKELKSGSYGRVVLVKAMRGRDPGEVNPPPLDAKNGWGEVLPEVEVLSVDSTHRAMFDSINGPRVGEIVKGLLA